MSSNMSWNERIGHFIGSHTPLWLRYWIALHAGVHATTGEYSDTEVPALSMMDMLQRVGEDAGILPRSSQ